MLFPESIFSMCLSCVLIAGTLGLLADTVSVVNPSSSNVKTNTRVISLKDTRVWGPGLRSDFLMPVRYFYIQAVYKDGENATDSIGEKAFSVSVAPRNGVRARIWTQVLDLHNGVYIVRYRLFGTTSDLEISIQIGQTHVAQSPYIVHGQIHNEACFCPVQSADEWTHSVGCQATYSQIERDLHNFPSINMTAVAKAAIERFSARGQHSICHYKIISNKVYRNCYGQHIGFKMFSDAILLSLTRKMQIPDTEFIMNLGDWPLENRKENPIPIMSWCGSEDTWDIVLPTYDLTEATLEMMGRVTLDVFSTQANTGPKWVNKTNKAFWRGRDSRKERLHLVQLSRKHPELVDAALTNMFFFPKDEAKYGEITKHVSFFDFFKYKYQLNIDGTVAAYRMPYLLAGDAVVFKQESKYYENFYSQLQPYVHYVPLKHNLDDLLEKIKWAQENDEKVMQIAQNGQKFAKENLNPSDVLCYHVQLLQRYSKLLINEVKGVSGFELVEQPVEKFPCHCERHSPSKMSHEEL